MLMAERPAYATEEAIPAYKRKEIPVDQRVSDLVGRMTVEEKARQLDMYFGAEFCDKRIDRTHAFPGAHIKAERMERDLGDLGAGSIHDLYPSPDLANEMQAWVIKHSRLGIPALFLEEGLHGYMAVNQTVFPHSINLATTWNPVLAKQTAAAIAAETRAKNVHMILGPVLCLARDPRWGRVEETFGEDPYLSGQIGLNYVEGMQGDSLNSDHTVIADPKHFAAHGSPESGVNVSPVHAGEREVRTIMLKSFEPAIRDGHAMSVMVAYHSLDGIGCAGNPWLLNKVLRDEWGFQGFVLADLGAVRRLWDAHHQANSPAAAVCLALNSGVDMQFFDFDHDTFQNAIISGINDGSLTQAVLDRAVGRVLRVKFMLGLFDNPFIDPALDRRVSHCRAHQDLALESARQSMCLLKNDGNLLPLSKSMKKIAILGPNAGVARLGDYCAASHRNYTSMSDAIKAVVSPKTEVVFDEGENIESAVAKVKGADVVILGLGEWTGISGEGFDRMDLNLPGNQQQLLEAAAATGVPVVVVLQNGRPLSIPWAAGHVPAILEAWYPGELGGQAIAETLFGDNNPAGRLPVSFPRSVGQLPVYYNRDSSMGGSYVDGDWTPLFAFGHGLSYTTFQYSNLTVTPPQASPNEDIAVTVDVRNAGSREGDEVVQLYLRKLTASVVTPSKALKAFSRVHLKPGETKTVGLHLTPGQLELWNTRGEWAVESGDYVVTVGGSSEGGVKGGFTIKCESERHPSNNAAPKKSNKVGIVQTPLKGGSDGKIAAPGSAAKSHKVASGSLAFIPAPKKTLASSQFENFSVSNLFDGKIVPEGLNTAEDLGGEYACDQTKEVSPVVWLDFGSAIKTSGIAYSQRSGDDSQVYSIKLWFFDEDPNTGAVLPAREPDEELALTNTSDQNLTRYDFAKSHHGRFVVLQLISGGSPGANKAGAGGGELRFIDAPQK